MSSLFGQLATKFGQSPEDLATEGLRHVLSHRVAGTAFVEYIRAQSNAELRENLLFRTQQDTDEGEGRADMKAVAGDGSVPLLVESKFWAGLTANQPNGYLRHLEGTSGGVLLFLAPHPRLKYLWPKLRERAGEEFPIEVGSADDEEEFVLPLQNGATLLLRSWQEVLNAIESAVQAEGGHSDLLDDLRQVRGLCDRHSDAGFLPFRGDDIGQDVGKRVHQLRNIVLAVDPELGKLWTADRNVTSSRYRYGLRTKLHGFDAVIAIIYYWWSADGRSPIWLRLKAETRNRRDEVLRALEPDIQARRDKETSYPTDVLIPLPPKLGVEKDEVIADLAGQLNKIAERLTSVLTGKE